MGGRALQRLAHELSEPRCALWCALLGMLLTSPALGSGAVVDDIYLQAQARHSGWWGILEREQRSVADNTRALADGKLPWWADVEVQPPRHLRPLGSALHAFDFRVLPYEPFYWHLHSMGWYGLLCASAVLLYRRLLGPGWVAGLAGVMFAVDDGHGLVAGHIAARPALAGATLAIWSVLCHARAVDTRRIGFQAVAAGLLFAALLTYELSIGALGLLAGYALWIDTRPRTARLRSLVPYLLVVGGWFVLFEQHGSGGSSGGLYVDPLHQPWLFLRQALPLLPVYVAGLATWFPSELWLYLAPAQQQLASVACAVVAVALAALLRGGLAQGSARVFVLGVIVSLGPAFAAFANDRMLLMASLGSAPVIACGCALLASSSAAAWKRAASVALIALHVFVAATLLPVRSLTVAATYGRIHARSMEALPSDAGLARRTLIMVNAPDWLISIASSLRGSLGGVEPRRALLLGASAGAVVIERSDPFTLRVEAERGYLGDVFSQLYRSPSRPLSIGYHVRWDGIHVTVESLTPDGRPRAVRFQFPRPLEDGELYWTTFREDRFVPFQPPAPGERVREPAPRYPGLLLPRETPL